MNAATNLRGGRIYSTSQRHLRVVALACVQQALSVRLETLHQATAEYIKSSKIE